MKIIIIIKRGKIKMTNLESKLRGGFESPLDIRKTALQRL